MTSIPFQQTPLFQLNLMIWLSWPSPVTSHPIFLLHGFELAYISPSIPVPLSAKLAASNATPPLPMTGTPSPDLLLRHRHASLVITLECKVSSFPEASEQGYQATALLSCIGPHIADTLLGIAPPSGWTAITLYAVTHPQQTVVEARLDNLTVALQHAGIATTPSTALGIDVRADGVYLCSASPQRLPIPINGDIKVKHLDVGEDPRPLYIIPVDPSIDANDLYGVQALEEQLRAAFAAKIGAQLGDPNITIMWEDLMQDAIPVWDIWRDPQKRTLIRQFKPYARGFLSEISDLGVIVEYPPDGKGFRLREIGQEKIKDIYHYLDAIIRKRTLSLTHPKQLDMLKQLKLLDNGEN